MECARGESSSVRQSVTFCLVLLVAAACSTTPKAGEPPKLARFFLESASGQGATAVLPQSEATIVVSIKPVLTEFDVTGVEIAEVEMGKCLLFQLTPAAARDLYRLSASNQGRRIVLIVDGQALGARRIDRPIEEGVLLIFVETADSALPALQSALRKTAEELQRTSRKT